MKVYISASIKNIPMTTALSQVIEGNDHYISCKWWEYNLEDGSITWEELAVLEYEAVLEADALIFLPGSKGSHFELGVAYTRGIPIYVMEECEGWGSSLFHALPGLHRLPFEDLITAINNG